MNYSEIHHYAQTRFETPLIPPNECPSKGDMNAAYQFCSYTKCLIKCALYKRYLQVLLELGL